MTPLHRSTLRAKYKAEDYLSNSYRGKTPPTTLSPPPTRKSAKEREQVKEEKKSQVLWVDPDEEELRRKLKEQASAVETQDLDTTDHKGKATICPDRQRYVVTL